MRSIVFGGVDFGALTRAKVVEESALAVKPDVACVPGRAGAAILDAEVPPKVVRVKLFLEPMAKMNPQELDSLRRRLHAALLTISGAELRYSDNYVYRDALCTDAKAWDALFKSRSCELTFTIYDPIAYSRVRRVETAPVFDIGGTWETTPAIEITTKACSFVEVAYGDLRVGIDSMFAEGDVLALDFESETAALNGKDVSGSIDIYSDFFSLQPGRCALTFIGAASHKVSFYERWV